MAQPLNPQSPSPPPGDDDISLDDMEERHQQRPRLPDQRKEKQQFEMAAPAAPAREAPRPEFQSVFEETAISDEIETYDPRAVERAPAPAPGAAAPPPASAEPVKVRLEPTAGLDDLEEFIARTASEGPQADRPARPRQPFSMVEKVCCSAGALILLTLGVWLFRAVAKESNAVPAVSTAWPDVPMEGSLIVLSEASTNWRARTDTDRVAQMEVIMPVPGRQTPDYIPQVGFSVDSSASKSGYLRFIFRDSEGKPRGDTRVVQVENGKLRSMDRGEIIKSDTEGAVYCSEGLLSIHAYYSYTAENRPRWSVEVAESASYGAADKEWKVLGTFDIRDDLAR